MSQRGTATRRDLCDCCDSSVASNDNAPDRAGQRFHRRSAEGHCQLSDAADERHDPRDPLADESNQRDGTSANKIAPPAHRFRFIARSSQAGSPHFW